MLEMSNVAKRMLTAKAAVFFWAGFGIKKIVIADATGQTLLDESDVRLLHQMDVEVEQIHYLQDDALIIKKGKGYGEGALINFAMKNSKFLQSASHFFKCTGKIYCRNFLEIFNLVQQTKAQNIFWREVFSHTIDTRFFYVSKDFAQNHLIPAYDHVDDIHHMTSEVCVMKLAQERLTPVTSLRPMLAGFSGSLNKPYLDVSMGYLDQNLPCWVSQ